jgi:hypothetical protein
MNCSTVEKWIYLFDELEEEDRASANRHIATCPACQKVYLRVRNDKDFLRRTMATLPGITNRARLTSSIMAAVNHEHSQRSPVFDLAWYFSKAMRNGLVALSLFLVSFFFVQYNQANHVASSGTNTKAAMVELNSTMFYQNFNRTKQSGVSTAAFSIHYCLQACQKSSASECFACKSRFTKLTRQYETI